MYYQIYKKGKNTVSEYQYYEFQAIDKPLSTEQRETVQDLSSCRVPCDHGHIPERSYALYRAREILHDMLNDHKVKV